jgi:alanine dehydrogenase
VLLLSRADVVALLDLDELRDAVGTALAELSAGSVSMPPRIAAAVRERDAMLAAMPAYVPALGALTTKLVGVFPHNTERPSHQALIACFDASDGTPVAIMDGTEVTAARTAAGSALATDLLARRDARVLAILGTGVQARSHARAVTRVRTFTEVRVWGRRTDAAEAFAAELHAAIGLSAQAVGEIADALIGADVVCATTHADEPVVRRQWLSPGVHVNSVGYNTAGREVDAETVAAARLVVESRAAALAPPPAGSNDLLWPIRDGLIGPEHVHAELGELVSGRASGRVSDEEITLYKSVGVAVEDAAAAALVLRAARQRGVGREVEL